ncbi:MAG: chemotaxis protein CheW [Polyangiaceae bacterium]
MASAPEELRRSVLFKLGAEFYAFPVTIVREMVRSQPAARVPGSKPFVRGVINLRGTILPLIDLRVLLGMGSAADEVDRLTALLTERQKDHEAWLDELERCVRTGDPFKRATDPHQCAFGQWFDSYKTDSLVMRTMLARLDIPHKAIHATAGIALSLASAGRLSEALSEVENARRGPLGEQVKTLAELRTLGREVQRELVVVIEEHRNCVGVCVDSIEGVEMLPTRGRTMDLDLGVGAEMVLRPGGGAPVRLFDANHIISRVTEM